MKQLTGAQPINHKDNNSPNKKNSAKTVQEENKAKRKNNEDAQIDENEESPEYIRSKRLENIKKREENNSIDDEADQQMPVTERGKNSSRHQPKVLKNRNKRNENGEDSREQRKQRRTNINGSDEDGELSPNDINLNFK